MKPKVFIASSVEGKPIADAIQVQLEHDAECKVWDQDVFQLSSSTIDDLLSTVSSRDFGIFVFSPDDVLELRSKSYAAIRDNVLLELGLVMGRLGKHRAYIVMPRDASELRIPTDLIGVTPATYDSEHAERDRSVALGPVCTRIRQLMQAAFIPRAGLYFGNHFETPIGDGWKEYTDKKNGSLSLTQDSVSIIGSWDAGFEFPRVPKKVDGQVKFLLFRVRKQADRLSIYCHVSRGGRSFHLAFNSELSRFGWDQTGTEFHIPIKETALRRMEFRSRRSLRGDCGVGFGGIYHELQISCSGGS